MDLNKGSTEAKYKLWKPYYMMLLNFKKLRLISVKNFMDTDIK